VRKAPVGHQEHISGFSGQGGHFGKFFLVIQNSYDLDVWFYYSKRCWTDFQGYKLQFLLTSSQKVSTPPRPTAPGQDPQPQLTTGKAGSRQASLWKLDGLALDQSAQSWTSTAHRAVLHLPPDIQSSSSPPCRKRPKYIFNFTPGSNPYETMS